MKLKDVEVGGRYHARVSGTLAVVRVVEIKQIPSAYHLPNGNWRTIIYAVNEATGRRGGGSRSARLNACVRCPRRAASSAATRSIGMTASSPAHIAASAGQGPDPECRFAYQGRFWTYVGDDLHPHTVLRYTPNHSRDGPGGPAEVLKYYSGFVQADAFSGYDAIYLGSQGRIIEVACWAHARRKFFEAQNADRARAEIALAHIAQLYAVEKQLREHLNGDWKGLDRLERFQRILAERQARSLPVLNKLGDWLEAESPRVLPENPIREAVDYARNNWTALN